MHFAQSATLTHSFTTSHTTADTALTAKTEAETIKYTRTSVQYTVTDACRFCTFHSESLLHLPHACFIAQCILTTAHAIYAFLKTCLL